MGKKYTIAIAVDNENKVILIDEKLQVEHQEAYLELIDTVRDKIGPEVVHYEWRFRDECFKSLSAMSEWFLENSDREITNKIFKDKPECKTDKDLIAVLSTTKSVLKATLECIDDAIEEYVNYNGRKGLRRNDE